MDDVGPPRTRGILPGFANSADLGGLPLAGGRVVPARRVVRANTPGRLTDDELAAARAVDFGLVVDLRSAEELLDRPHPLAQLPGYRSLPLIDPAAEARADMSRYRTLGEIYSSSLERNATHIAAIFTALATAPPEPALISCRAGRDRTGMVVALLLDLAGVDREVVVADYALFPVTMPPAVASGTPEQHAGAPMAHMLEHVDGAYGSTAGYLRRLGLDDILVDRLRQRLRP